MTISRAIETLKADLISRHPYTREEVNTAIELGIEALQRLWWIRTRGYRNLTDLLPGETED